MSFISQQLYCSQQALVQPQQVAVEDGTSVSIVRYTGSQSRSDIIITRIESGGHAWPRGVQQPEVLLGKTTQNLNASQFIWNLFKDHSL